ncbi:cupin domain-containing protein [Acanthopleuribacter pedis]|uniref:Cupin domain-containing protein n=1 Tax=Acanthopleuribacter pedis TaxID=442870 RepID=A0A8J7U6H1_9BACT|nr:cupin domain-containing protein [Acanthopleuribacter pedis]MBO1321914.1 cupin domain-containing protein [Acanthopleuribacter pedis]
MKRESSAFLFGDHIAVERIEPGIQRQLLGYGETILMARVTFDQDAVGALHRHPHAQATYVESGEFDVTINGERQRLRRGDGFYVTPHQEHGAVCRKPGVLIDVFSPAREDFLKEQPPA